jgi:hypothetical protein
VLLIGPIGSPQYSQATTRYLGYDFFGQSPTGCGSKSGRQALSLRGMISRDNQCQFHQAWRCRPGGRIAEQNR